jgi:hypothetical protein
MYSCVIRYEAGCLSSSGGRDMTSWVSRCPDRALVGGCGCLKHTPREAWYIEGSYGVSGVGFLRDDGGSRSGGERKESGVSQVSRRERGPSHPDAAMAGRWYTFCLLSVICHNDIDIIMCSPTFDSLPIAAGSVSASCPKSRGTYASTPCRSAAEPERDAPPKMDDILGGLFPPLHHHLLCPL